jgi:hypothetical protein
MFVVSIAGAYRPQCRAKDRFCARISISAPAASTTSRHSQLRPFGNPYRPRRVARSMARTTFLIVDHSGARLGILKAWRERWLPGEKLVVRGRSYQVAAVVELERPEPSGATAMLVVTEPSADTA